MSHASILFPPTYLWSEDSNGGWYYNVYPGTYSILNLKEEIPFRGISFLRDRKGRVIQIRVTANCYGYSVREFLFLSNCPLSLLGIEDIEVTNVDSFLFIIRRVSDTKVVLFGGSK